MKKSVSVLCIALSLFSLTCHQTAARPEDSPGILKARTVPETIANCSGSTKNENWEAANFRGLVIGQADAKELRKVLGEPMEIADLSSIGDKDHQVYHYISTDQIPGKLKFTINKKTQIVEELEHWPSSVLSRNALIKYLGGNCAVHRYSMVKCAGGPFDSACLKEEPNGEIEVIEYRANGIAVFFSEDANVQYISYLSKLGGSTFSIKK